MGRPIQKKWFGPATTPGTQIVVSGVKFADGTTATGDFIIKQTGSNAYVVQDSALTHEPEIVFMVNATGVGALNPGECFILATPFGGSARPCAKIAQYRLDLFEADGSVASYSWSTIPAAALGEADLITGTGSVGALLTLAVNDPGAGYFTAPAVTLTGGGGGGAAHTTIAGGSVATAVIDSAGMGYSGVSLTAPPAPVTVTVARTLTNGVLGLTVTNAATNGFYAGTAALIITPPPAAVTATATGTATAGAVDAAVVVGNPAANGFYPVAPNVAVVGGNSDATAHAVLTANRVTSIVIDAPGTGYTTPVAFTIDAPPAPVAGAGSTVLTGNRVTSIGGVAGTGYFVAPSVTVPDPDVAPVQATLSATFSV
jgi:hypothetical protein